MGLLDRIRQRPPQTQATDPTPAPPRQFHHPDQAPVLEPIVRPVHPEAYWVPPGQSVTLAGYQIPNGMLYCGAHLPAARTGIEPALIDVSLPIDRTAPDWLGHHLPFWPAYGSLPAGARAAYLAWLADGRRFAAVPMAYVFLFLSGLERRVLRDLPEDSGVRAELPAVRSEVERLLAGYGRNRTFHTSAVAFLEVLDLLREDAEPPVPPTVLPEPATDIPLALRIGLGRFAATGTPVPADWAQAWASYLPCVRPGPVQRRCAEEFRQLFTARYTRRHRAGIVVPAGDQRVSVVYRAANRGIGPVTLTLAAPDVWQQPGPGRDLEDLVTSIVDDLDAYSRWVVRHPDERGTLAEAAVLPAELSSGRTGQLAVLRAWCEARLAGGGPVVVNGADLVGFWPAKDPRGMTRTEAAGLSHLLHRFGVGLEPDVRMGGASLTPGSAVLFRTGPEARQAAGPRYRAATLLARLSEQDPPWLSPDETVRLAAHRRWLAEIGPPPLDESILDDAGRELLHRFTATADPDLINAATVLAEQLLDDVSHTPIGRHRAPDRLGNTQPVDGLDRPHSTLVRLLAAEPSWTRHDFDDLAERCDVLPAGAIDLLNEVALDRTGNTVLDGDDHLVVNATALSGLLG